MIHRADSQDITDMTMEKDNSTQNGQVAYQVHTLPLQGGRRAPSGSLSIALEVLCQLEIVGEPGRVEKCWKILEASI